MTEQKVKKQTPAGPDGEVCRDLVCPEEWKDPEGRKIITEFHKEGLPKELVGVDADLETFERYWKKKGGSVKVKGEYHKEGAPFLDSRPLEDISSETKESFEVTVEANPPVKENTVEEPTKQPPANPTPPAEVPNPVAPDGSAPQNNVRRQIDMGLIEMISYALFRVAFRNGVNIPIKRDGVIDMDVTVKGKEITINTNQLYFSVPELNVWHVVYQHKGKPILELGRGVKNGMRIHRLASVRLGLEMWNGSRKMNKMKLKQLMEADRKAHAGPEDG
jgi:hypothetical protein